MLLLLDWSCLDDSVRVLLPNVAGCGCASDSLFSKSRRRSTLAGILLAAPVVGVCLACEDFTSDPRLAACLPSGSARGLDVPIFLDNTKIQVKIRMLPSHSYTLAT